MSVNTRFKKLLEPGYIGKLKLRNRMVKSVSSLGYQYDEFDGHMTPRQIAYSAAIARGGAALLISEGGTLDYPLGAHDVFHFRIDEDEYIPGWAKLAEAVHQYDCRLFAQMVHSGPWHIKKYDGLDPIAASAGLRVEEGGRPDTTKEATIAQIKEIVGKFAAAARRYQKAGFDGVEINASGNHLLNSFLSRGFNRRHDEYGCDNMENRCRIVVEIIHAVKDLVGKDYPVGVIFNAIEYDVPNGLTIEETREFARIYEREGADYLQVRIDGVGKYLSSHYPELIFYPEPPANIDRVHLDVSGHGAGLYAPLAADIKKVVKIPIIAVGRLDPERGEKLLREGKADFIAMNKRIIADPYLPTKVAEGRLEDIAPCTACEHCISYRVYRYPVRCRINAALGSEDDYDIKPATRKKKVLVVGSGPAGLEAARVAAARGHEVTLYEKEHKLGGLLPLAALVKGLEGEDLVAFVEYFKTQLNKLGVKVNLGQEFQPAMIDEIKPDVAILALGGKPVVPDIPGVNRKNVVSGHDLHKMLKFYLRFIGPKTLRELTRLWMPVGKKVVIIGGAIQGAELAEYLVKRGRKVTIVGIDDAKEVGNGLPRRKQMRLIEWLGEKGATMITQAKVDEITDKGVVITNKDGQKQTLEADTVIPAVPFAPNTELEEALKGKVPEVYNVGDSSKPDVILEAVAAGWKIGNTI